jgi:hypothetical protein
VARDSIEAFVFVLGSGIAGFRGMRECSSVEWLVLEENLNFLGIYNDCKSRERGRVERKALQQFRGVAIMSTNAQWLRFSRSWRKRNSMNTCKNNHWSDSKLAGCPLIPSQLPAILACTAAYYAKQPQLHFMSFSSTISASPVVNTLQQAMWMHNAHM